jgi:aspartate aminotransferase
MFVIDEMAYKAEQAGYKDVIRMTLGKAEKEMPLHPSIIKAITNTFNDWQTYSFVVPPGIPQLRQALVEHYKEQYDLTVPMKNIIVNVGTSSLFRNLFYLLANENDEVLLPLPYYSLYNFCALLAGAKIKYYKIDTKNLTLDMKSFEENFSDKTKIVVICSPGNPLGNIITKEELRKMDKIINGRAVVINDEIYINCCFDEQSPSALEMNKEGAKTTFITTNSFSKAYRMYARRVGWAIVPDELVEPMTVMQHHTLLCTDPAMQFGGIEALKRQDEVKALVKLYGSRRDYTTNAFKGSMVRAIHAKGSFYYTLDCEQFMKHHGVKTSLELAQQIMEQKRVATVPGSDFGLPYTLRLSYTHGNYNEGIDRLVDFFKNYKKKN